MSSSYERSWGPERQGRGAWSAGDAARDSYYGLPPIHRPHWKWLIICYFFLGGISSASYTVAAIAQLLGRSGHAPITRVGRYLSLVTLIPCPILLILDLGRPERFHHMLRVLKLRSPMSAGTWGLTIFGAFSTLQALQQAAQDGLLGRGLALPSGRRLPMRALAALGLGPSFFVGGYTGVLLAATAVPLWTRNHLLMGPLFLSSALSTGTSAIALILALAGRASQRSLARLERLETLVLLFELVLLLANEARLGSAVRRCLVTGRLGLLYRCGVQGAGVVVPLALQWRMAFGGAAPSRLRTAGASLLVLVGGFLLRYVMIMAGRQSADDPASTFRLSREGA